MSPVSRDPLTPEERELASRLSRIGPHGEPPATLDTRILSAAHAALAAAPPRHRRWPAVLGVAATLALAVGISWQLRPRPEAAPVLEEGPAAASQAVAPHAEAADAAAAMPPPPVSEAEAEATANTPQPQPQPQRVPPVATRSKAPALQAPPAIVESAEAPDEPPMELAPAMAPAPAPAPAPAAAPPAPPPPRPAPEAAAAAAPMSATAASDRAAAAGAAKAAQRSASPQPVAADRLEVGTVPRIGNRAARDVPIEEDARLAATDWLDRIRLRQAADDVEGARASLALFRRHYPDHAIPQDLAPLAQ